MIELPTHCYWCGVVLRGGATLHAPSCEMVRIIRDVCGDDAAQRATRPSITCPRCGFTSYHPRDIAERYCGMCHEFRDGCDGGGS